MATGLERNKHLNRPRKSDTEKRRRRKAHEKRLTALGVPTEKLVHFNTVQIRAMIRHPKKTAALAAKKRI